jgi:hypothetical protein
MSRHSLLSIAVALAALTVGGRAASADGNAPAGHALSEFAGHWVCSGHFEPSGKRIDATIDASWNAAANALSLRHDDIAPGKYHSVELWTSAGDDGRGSAAIADGFSGMRVFALSRSPADEIVLTRSGPDGKVIETFSYGPIAQGSFEITWRIVRKAGVLEIGDRVSCARAPAG